MKNFITAIVLTLAAASLVTTTDIPPAEAASCVFAEASVDFTIPSDGAVVPENPLIFAVSRGEFRDDQKREIRLIETKSGEEIETESERDRGKSILVPDQPLDAGEYQLSITFRSGAEPETSTFTVDDTLDSLPTPDAVDFGWYHDRSNSGCGPREWSAIDIDRPSTAPDFYEVVMRDDEGSKTFKVLSASSTTTSATIKEDTDTECVTVTGVMADGTRGESVEDCWPQVFGPGCFSGCQTAGGSAPSTPYWLLFAALFGLLALNRRRVA